MRKRFLLISTIFVLSAFTLAACGKKSPSSPEASSETTEEATTEEPTTENNTEDTTEKETPVSTATEATKSSTEEVSTASKKDEQAKPNGFADTNSVEIELSNGNFETFLVNDDDVKTALSKKSEGSKITFTYGAVEGQANKEILSVK